MSRPRIIAEIAFQQPSADLSSATWTDVSARLRGWHVKAGRQQQLSRVEPGEIDVTLDNKYGALDPDNPGSPWNGQVKPLRRIRLRAEWPWVGILTNWNFTTGTTGWSGYSVPNENNIWLSDGTGYAGFPFVRMQASSANTTNQVIGMFQVAGRAAKPGDTYVLTARMRYATGTAREYRLEITFLDANGQVIRTDYTPSTALSGTDWNYLTFASAAAPSGTTKVRADVLYGTGGAIVSGDAADVTAIVLDRGAQAITSTLGTGVIGPFVEDVDGFTRSVVTLNGTDALYQLAHTDMPASYWEWMNRGAPGQTPSGTQPNDYPSQWNLWLRLGDDPAVGVATDSGTLANSGGRHPFRLYGTGTPNQVDALVVGDDANGATQFDGNCWYAEVDNPVPFDTGLGSVSWGTGLRPGGFGTGTPWAEFCWRMVMPSRAGGAAYALIYADPWVQIDVNTSGQFQIYITASDQQSYARVTWSGCPPVDDGKPHTIGVMCWASGAWTKPSDNGLGYLYCRLWIDGVEMGKTDTAASGTVAVVTQDLSERSSWRTTLGSDADVSLQAGRAVPAGTILDEFMVQKGYHASNLMWQTGEGSGWNQAAIHWMATVGRRGDTVTQRLHMLLDMAQWPEADRNLDASNTLLQEQPLGGQALDALNQVADTDFGLIYADRNGQVRFRGRQTILRPPAIVPKATLSDAPGLGELPYASLGQPTYTPDNVINQAQVTRRGGSTQTVTDTASKNDYGLLSAQISDLLLLDDNTAHDFAAFVVQQNKDPRRRIDSITIDPDGDPGWWPLLLGGALEDRYTVKRHTEYGTTRVYDLLHEGWEITQTGENRGWTVTWNFAPAAGTKYMVLDDATYGRLDASALAY